MYDLPVGLYMMWAGAVSFYFMLFWAYWPFAMAAQELSELTARYK